MKKTPIAEAVQKASAPKVVPVSQPQPAPEPVKRKKITTIIFRGRR